MMRLVYGMGLLYEKNNKGRESRQDNSEVTTRDSEEDRRRKIKRNKGIRIIKGGICASKNPWTSVDHFLSIPHSVFFEPRKTCKQSSDRSQ